MAQSGKAFIFDPKGVDLFSFVDSVPVPAKIGKNEVLIKIIAAGLNPVDYKLPQAMPMFMLKGKPVGMDVCGTVIRVGSSVSAFSAGDVICGSGPGLSEYTLVSCNEIVKVPEGVSTEVAGCLGVAGLTAYQMLKNNGAFEGSDAKKILVIGASGGVGSLVVQIAKALCAPGTEILGMCSARSSEFVMSLGATKIIDYTVPSFDLATALPAGTLDLVADCVSSPDDTDYVPSGMPLIKKTGKYVAINSGSKLDWIKCFISKATGIKLFRGAYSLLLADRSVPDLLAVTDLVAKGKLHIHIHARKAFHETMIREGYTELKGRRVHGKIVVLFA